MSSTTVSHTFTVQEYDLDATLSSGQAFRWQKRADAWSGIIGGQWVRLRAEPLQIKAETVPPMDDWSWLIDYLQLEVDLSARLRTFPDDEPMRTAVNACRGLRL